MRSTPGRVETLNRLLEHEPPCRERGYLDLLGGDRRRAAWVAILLAQLRIEWREPVVAQGWYQRASAIVTPAATASAQALERAHAAYARGEWETAIAELRQVVMGSSGREKGWG